MIRSYDYIWIEGRAMKVLSELIVNIEKIQFCPCSSISESVLLLVISTDEP